MFNADARAGSMEVMTADRKQVSLFGRCTERLRRECNPLDIPGLRGSGPPSCETACPLPEQPVE